MKAKKLKEIDQEIELTKANIERMFMKQRVIILIALIVILISTLILGAIYFKNIMKENNQEEWELCRKDAWDYCGIDKEKHCVVSIEEPDEVYKNQAIERGCAFVSDRIYKCWEESSTKCNIKFPNKEK